MTTHKKPFFFLKKEQQPYLQRFYGDIKTLSKLDQLCAPEKGVSINLIPFNQAKERGFEVHDDGESIQSLRVKTHDKISLKKAIDHFPKEKIDLNNAHFDLSSQDYEQQVSDIIQHEIGNGEGANFVLSRRFQAHLDGDIEKQALSIFRSLLCQEYGAYWTYLFFDSQRYFIGASPERHISCYENTVTMNPISGTFRKNPNKNRHEQEKDLLSFLDDQKEIFELFMVSDEELKMMCHICQDGGHIKGPYLKEMAHVIHTEYVLEGHSQFSIPELLRASMYAPTVTGSPIQNAFRILKKYEKHPRAYYAATIAMIGLDENNTPFLDAPITIRSLELSSKGHLKCQAGATLVQSSQAKEEVKETEAKLAGLLNAIKKSHQATLQDSPKSIISNACQDKLLERNRYLAPFWMHSQTKKDYKHPTLLNKKVLLIDFEDAFSLMIQQCLKKLGFCVDYHQWSTLPQKLPTHDLLFLGPGPGNPCHENDPKIRVLDHLIESALKQKKRFFAECLSHQVLCKHLGLMIDKKKSPYQGIQEAISLFGKTYRMGFYNTFVGRFKESRPDIEIAYDTKTKAIHAIKGSFFHSVQFHPESLLSSEGLDYFKEQCLHLFENA